MTSLTPCEPDELLQSLRMFSGFACEDESKPLEEAEATCIVDFMEQFGINNQSTAEAVGVSDRSVRNWRKDCRTMKMEYACKLIPYLADADGYREFASSAPDSLGEIIERECGKAPANRIDMFCFQFMERSGAQRRRESSWDAYNVEDLALHELLSMASWQLDERERRIIGRMMATLIESNKSRRATSADIALADAYMDLTDNMTVEPESLEPQLKHAHDAMIETSKEINSYLRHVAKEHELVRMVDDLRDKNEEQQAEIERLTSRVKDLRSQRDDRKKEINRLDAKLGS